MQSVTLAWNEGATAKTQDFDVYTVNPYSIKLFRRHYDGLGGRLAEKVAGYRRIIEVDFAPLLGSKALAFQMMSFMFGSSRTVTFEAVTYNVTFDDMGLTYEFMQNTKFGNAFSLTFIEQALSVVTDTLSTRILKPLYTTAGQGIVSETLSIFCNLVDDVSLEVVKHNLAFINDAKDDVSFAYRHVLNIDIGLVQIATYRTWLTEFVQWGSKQVDTTGIDPDNGLVYDVVYGSDELRFALEGGIKDATSCFLVLRESTPRTSAESLAGAPVYNEDIYGDATYG